MRTSDLAEFLRDICDFTNDEIIKWFEGNKSFGFTANNTYDEVHYDSEETKLGERKTKRDDAEYMETRNGFKRINPPPECENNKKALLEALNLLSTNHL